MEKVDTCNETIKVSKAATAPADATNGSTTAVLNNDAKVRAAMADKLDKLTEEHARASFTDMPLGDRLRALTALVQVRECLSGALGRLGKGHDIITDRDSAEWYLHDYWDQNNGRIDALHNSLLAYQPTDDADRRLWLTAIVAYYGQLEYAPDELLASMPSLPDELRPFGKAGGRPEQSVKQDSAPAATSEPQSSTDFIDAEKRLLDCLEYGVVVNERKDDNTTNEQGYSLLDKIHLDVSDVFLRNIDARVVAQADRPCTSIADVKERVALLLHATHEQFDDSVVNDIYTGVRSSILTFAREGVTQ